MRSHSGGWKDTRTAKSPARLDCTERSVERKLARIRSLWTSYDDGEPDGRVPRRVGKTHQHMIFGGFHPPYGRCPWLKSRRRTGAWINAAAERFERAWKRRPAAAHRGLPERSGGAATRPAARRASAGSRLSSAGGAESSRPWRNTANASRLMRPSSPPSFVTVSRHARTSPDAAITSTGP